MLDTRDRGLYMKIDVTQEHINEGFAGDCGQCPVALAVKDAVRGAKHVYVDVYTISVGMENYSEQYDSPRTVRAFIAAFDKGKRVKPFSFYMSLVSAR